MVRRYSVNSPPDEASRFQKRCDAQSVAKVQVAISFSFTRVLVVLCKEVNNQIFHHWVPCAKVVSFVGWMDGG